jgi:hypothetical protein
MVDVYINDNDGYFIKNYMNNDYVKESIYKKDDNFCIKKFKDLSYENKPTKEEIFEEISILKALFYLDEDTIISSKNEPMLVIDGGSEKEVFLSNGLIFGTKLEYTIKKNNVNITPKSKFKVKNLEDGNIKHIMILFSEINNTNLLIRLRRIKEALDDYDSNKYYKYANITKNEWGDIKTTLNQGKSSSAAHNTKKEKYDEIENKILPDNAILNYFRRIIRYYVIEDRGFSEIEFLD